MPFVNDALAILGNVAENENNLELMAERLQQLAPFVGRGLTGSYGYKGWKQFLRDAATEFDLVARIEPLLATLEFEEAVEIIVKHAGLDQFKDVVQKYFDENKIVNLQKDRAVHQLARFSQGLVLTSNFDRVLEKAFWNAARPFREIMIGAKALEVPIAFYAGQNILLKLHGDYDDSDSWIITPSQYRDAYGSDDPGTVDFKKTLPSNLIQLLGTCSLLFLGCSLEPDRTTSTIATITRRLGSRQFALLPTGDDGPQQMKSRIKELKDWNIYPLFFSENNFEKITQFLACLEGALHRDQDQGRLQIPELRLLPKDMPPDFVARTDKQAEARQFLLDRGTPWATALVGAEGFGKTTLAHALCADADIQGRFDRTYWVHLGETPNLLDSLSCLYKELTGNKLNTADLGEAGAMVAESIKNCSILLVINSVWHWKHLKKFLDVSPDAKHLIITHKPEILECRADIVNVGRMDAGQSVKLLIGDAALSDEDSSKLRSIADRLGHCALLLKLAKGMLKHVLRVADGSLAPAIVIAHGKIDRYKIDAGGDSEEKWPMAVANTITMNLDLLSAQEQSGYRKLAIFPEDTAISCAAAEELWSDDLKDKETAFQHFHELALLEYSPQDRTFTLHRILCDWLRKEATAPNEAELWNRETFNVPDTSAPDLKGLHAQLLNKWVNPRRDPAQLPHMYAWKWIGWHSKEAGRSEIKGLLLDLDWIQAKMEHAGLGSLITDYDLVQPSEPHRLLRRALAQSSHIIIDDPAQFSVQLLARLVDAENVPEIEKLTKYLRDQQLAKPGHLIPSWPSLNSELLCTLHGDAGVTALALGASETLLVSGHEDGTIKIWDLVTGQQMRNMPRHKEAVLSLSLSHDESILASSSNDAIKIFNLTTRDEFPVVETPCQERSVMMRDGSTLIFSSPNKITTLNWLTKKSDVVEVSFSGPQSWKADPQGSKLVFGSPDYTIRVRYLNSRQESFWPSGQASIQWLALSGDASRVASASIDNIRIWSLEGESVLPPFSSAKDITALALDKNGSILVSGSGDGSLAIWKLLEPQEKEPKPIPLKAHDEKVTAITFSRDGRTLISGSLDKTIKIWDLAMGPKERPCHPRQVMSVALHQEARKLVSGCGGSIKVWELTNGKLRHEKPQPGRAISWRTNRKELSSPYVVSAGDNSITIWEPKTKNAIKNKPSCLEGHTDEVTAVVLSDDGNTLVSGARDKTIRIWDLGTERTKRELKEHKGEITALALNRDASILISGSADKTIMIWDLVNGQEPLILRGHEKEVTSVALSANGNILASGSADKTIRIWDLSGNLIHTLPAHAGGVQSVALSHDGHTLVSGSMDRTIKVWDLGQYHCHSAFNAESAILCIALSPWNELGAGDESGRIHVFKVFSCGSN